MVTVNQVVKAYSSAVKAADREQKRRAREATQRFKEQQKQQELNDAARIVKNYNEYIEVLMSIHKNCTDKIDWNQILQEQEPEKPENKGLKEFIAQQRLINYKPSIIDKIFGTKRKIKALNVKIDKARKQDEKDFIEEQNSYDDWLKIQSIAIGVEAKETKAYADAMEYFDPFDDISEIGSKIQLSFNKDTVEVNLHVNSIEVIPNYIVSQTKTGKLSQKDMPKSKFHELYQDYVCGSLLRVAREVLTYLPIKMVVVHAMSEMVNSSTGHLEEVPIISAMFPPETIDKLNFQTLDPSDSMVNFIHNMKFTKTKGFSPVNKVEFVNVNN